MERFRDAVDVTCSPNSIQLTVNNKAHFKEIQREWGWVNDAEENYIILITENDCLADDSDLDRQPWHITHATFDTSTKVVSLAAEPKTWQDALGYWNLHVSSKGLSTYGSPSKRSLLGADKTISISLDHPFGGDPIALSDIASIACNPCDTHGSLDFDFHFDATDDNTVTVTPSGVGVTVTAALTIGGEVSGLSKTQNLVDIPLDGGFDIKGIASGGPQLKIDLVAGINQASAEIDLSTGVTVSIPDDSSATMDFDDSSQNSLNGWVPTFDFDPPSLGTGITLSASAGVEVRLDFEATVFKKGAAAGLALDAPTLQFDFAGSDDACSGAAGVDVDLSLVGKLDGYAGFGSVDDKPNDFNILSTATPIWSTCMNVGGGDSPTTPPSQTASMATPTPTGSVSASATPSGSSAASPSGSTSVSPSGSGSVLPTESSSVTPSVSGSSPPTPSGSASSIPDATSSIVARESSSAIQSISSAAVASTAAGSSAPAGSPAAPASNSSAVASASSVAAEPSSANSVAAAPSAAAPSQSLAARRFRG